MPIHVDNSRLKGLMQKNIDKQLNFALVNTLNNVSFSIMKSTKRAVPAWVNIKKSWIPNSVFVLKATKNSMKAFVYFDAKRAPLAGLMEAGGTLLPRRRTLTIPAGGTKRTKSGLISKNNRPRALMARKDTFSGTIRNTAGIWQRNRKTGKIALLYSYQPKANYSRGTFKFQRMAQHRIQRDFDTMFSRNIDRALRSARR